MKSKRYFLLAFILSANFIMPSSHAVYGGEEVVGSERVVVILDSKESRNGGCSGASITSQIVLTAAHCLGKPGKHPGVIKNNHWGYWVSRPGVDFKSDDISTRVQSAYVVITDDYTNSFDPKSNDYATTIHDIAFIFLKEPIKISSYPTVASQAQVTQLKAERALITHYGYGLSDKGLQTGKPKRIDLKIRLRERSYEVNNVVPEDFSIITDETGVGALCGGDSGGPWYAQLDGKLLIVANTVGASGCGGPGSGLGGTFGTLVHQYESLLWKKWEYFLANKSEILKWESSALITNELRLKTLKNAGQYYQEETACHSNGIVAVLQSRKSGDWQDVATAEGGVTINDSCSQPWTAYRAQKGEILRWRLASPGAWEVFSTTFEEITSSKVQSNLAAELKAKQETEEKAAAELKAGQEAAAKAAAAKKITITCVKGKLTKKVTKFKPKCPKGYKKK
ncbi:MAG: trypsin-like serine protease [Candidatus Planktophila sp.]